MMMKEDSIRDIETKLWTASNKLRNTMDAANYKHVVLGLIFLKYMSDKFSKPNIPKQANRASKAFKVPKEARWMDGTKGIQDRAYDKNIGKIIDNAMLAIERANPALTNILPKEYSKVGSIINLGDLVMLISQIKLVGKETTDVLGHVYEYFLGQFASAEARKAGQFYTPRSIVNLIVECLKPYDGIVYDPAMGSGGFFVSSDKFIKSNKRTGKDKLTIYGQESNPTTWRLSAMNMVIRGLNFNFGKIPADTFTKNQHPNLKADFIMANPPFNVREWESDKLTNDKRWKYGIPPSRNANFAWIQHIVHHLSQTGYAAVVLANGSVSSQIKNEATIRKNIVNADLVDCIISLPGQLFLNTQIPACIWIMSKDRSTNNKTRNRKHEVLFIDARESGQMVNRTQKIITEDEIKQIANIYNSWKSKNKQYADIPGLCVSASLDEIKMNDYILVPGRYVKTKENDSDINFTHETKLAVDELKVLFDDSNMIRKNLKKALRGLGYDL